jgi:hypothetical protein
MFIFNVGGIQNLANWFFYCLLAIIINESYTKQSEPNQTAQNYKT